MRSKPTANLPGFSDSAAAADGRRGQRRRDSSPEHGNLGLLEAGLLRPSPESPSYRQNYFRAAATPHRAADARGSPRHTRDALFFLRL